MKSITTVLYKLTCHIMVVATSIMSLMVLINTILRWFGTGIVQNEELSRYLFVWMIFLGGVIAMADGIHITVDIVTRLLPESVLRPLRIFNNLVVTAICFILMCGGWTTTMNNTSNYSAVTDIPMSWVYFPVVISGAGMGIICLIRAIKGIMGMEDRPAVAHKEGAK